MFIIHWLIYFVLFILPFQLWINSNLSQLQQSPVPLGFPLPDVVITKDAVPNHWAFYFQGSGLPSSFSGTWTDSICGADIVLQAAVPMLHTVAFLLSGKMAALPLDNSTAKAYLCNLGVTVSLFSFQTSHDILNLANKHGTTLIPAYIHAHFNMETDYLSRGWLVPQWFLLPCIAEAAFHCPKQSTKYKNTTVLDILWWSGSNRWNRIERGKNSVTSFPLAASFGITPQQP